MLAHLMVYVVFGALSASVLVIVLVTRRLGRDRAVAAKGPTVSDIFDRTAEERGAAGDVPNTVR